MPSKSIAIALIAVALSACGDKVPESEEAKKIGNIPKQTIDRAQGDVDSAMKQAAGRGDEAEKKQEAGK